MSCVLGHPSRVWGASPLPPPHPHPPTLEFVCVLSVGNGGQRELRDGEHPHPHPICCSSSQKDVTQAPTKLMQSVHLRGFRGVLRGTQGSLVWGIMELRVLLGSWAVCFPGEGGFMFSFFFLSGPPNGVGVALIYPSLLTPSPFCTQWVTPGGFYPQFLYASANICTHIHAHIPGPMPTSHALPRLNTARGPTLCSTSYPFPAQEGISPQKHSESARMNLPHPPTHPQSHSTISV